jgi:mannosyl-oligosaccharide alpha-1,2-mannosidase
LVDTSLGAKFLDMRVSTLAYLSYAGAAAATPMIKAGQQVRMPLWTRDLSESEKADAVVEAFRHAWAGYKEYAFPADELLPVSNTAGNSR